ncbi:basic salivary proline-rich protein 1-like [Eleginops maclovinus]|uniref:basic salivary proline-rich protein 1-like n=1 Tax=Eleginops maclovinus TaxID=56733 RepID=UPI003080B777
MLRGCRISRGGASTAPGDRGGGGHNVIGRGCSNGRDPKGGKDLWGFPCGPVRMGHLACAARGPVSASGPPPGGAYNPDGTIRKGGVVLTRTLSRGFPILDPSTAPEKRVFQEQCKCVKFSALPPEGLKGNQDGGAAAGQRPVSATYWGLCPLPCSLPPGAVSPRSPPSPAAASPMAAVPPAWGPLPPVPPSWLQMCWGVDESRDPAGQGGTGDNISAPLGGTASPPTRRGGLCRKNPQTTGGEVQGPKKGEEFRGGGEQEGLARLGVDPVLGDPPIRRVFWGRGLRSPHEWWSGHTPLVQGKQGVQRERDAVVMQGLDCPVDCLWRCPSHSQKRALSHPPKLAGPYTRHSTGANGERPNPHTPAVAPQKPTTPQSPPTPVAPPPACHPKTHTPANVG